MSTDAGRRAIIAAGVAMIIDRAEDAVRTAMPMAGPLHLEPEVLRTSAPDTDEKEN